MQDNDKFKPSKILAVTCNVNLEECFPTVNKGEYYMRATPTPPNEKAITGHLLASSNFPFYLFIFLHNGESRIYMLDAIDPPLTLFSNLKKSGSPMSLSFHFLLF